MPKVLLRCCCGAKGKRRQGGLGWLLTDAGAQVAVLAVGPVVVGVAVVAAHGLQLDLLDLHGLCDGRVGRCGRRRRQTWREETERVTRRCTTGGEVGEGWGGRYVKMKTPSGKLPLQIIKKTNNKTFEIIQQ